ncbi:hypothetical protein [Paracoccus seriniphilus]|uniref:Uncharacterized protein n=1 Tax=Paracoccus seriniphilus TaxID=184748 RepID=A0A239PND3_9RHOB|nr:hypothetical protein [Paracoccus seriniphilus]WCR14771.1 permease [Paracoccus seriniphilus]SNT71819.1 hypothetical protein SAMN05444959_102337 [Paracoccus seriniphilus]
MNDMNWRGIDDFEGCTVSNTDAGAGLGDQTAEARRDCSPEEAISVAEGLFWSYIRDLKQHEAALEARERGAVDPAELKEATRSAKAVREAVHLLLAERNRVDKLRKDIAGGVGAGQLDLDSARDEIGRRLACLRRAKGG